MSILFGLLLARRFYCRSALSLSPGRTGGLLPRINAPKKTPRIIDNPRHFWQGQKDLPCASHSYGSPTVAVQQYPARRSSLKTVHRTVFLTLRPSRVQVLIEKKSRTSATLSFWQGQKDLNPRHVVLEQLGNL